MHWGHCVTSDFLEYEELPVALSPFEGGSLNGGSSLVKDGLLYLFYSCNNEVLSAVSEDGIHFSDTEFEAVSGDYDYFMDPHVFEYEGRYLMVVGTGRHNVAGIALYESSDLVVWKFVSDLVDDLRFGSHIESPNLFRVDDKWCLMFTSSRQLPSRNISATGDFDGTHFVPDTDYLSIESGPDLYNSYVFSEQSDRSPDGVRNIMLGWFFDRRSTSGAAKGMMTCAREVSLNKAGELCIRPAYELYDNYLVNSDSDFVSYDNGRLRVVCEKKTVFDKAYRAIPNVDVVADVGTVEAFINNGVDNITIVIC